MSDYSSPFGSIAVGQGDQVTKANALFDAASPAAMYGRNNATCTGLTWGYHGGKISINGVITYVASGTVTLAASSTNYIEATPGTGVVSSNTSGFTAGRIPLYTVTTGASTTNNDWVDKRVVPLGFPGYLAKSISDADTTLTQAEDANDILVISGTLTATRNIVISLAPRQRTVHNNTGQSLQFIGATGTGATVTAGSKAIIYSDGTNVSALSSGSGAAITAKDEGSNLTTSLASLDFVGAGVSATTSGDAVTVTINGATGTLSINTQTASYTLVSGDAEKYVRMNVGSANNLTVPPNSSVAFPTGTQVHVRQAGAGQTTVVAGSGVTINTPETLKLRKQQSTATLVKVATDTWELMGDLEAA